MYSRVLEEIVLGLLRSSGSQTPAPPTSLSLSPRNSATWKLGGRAMYLRPLPFRTTASVFSFAQATLYPSSAPPPAYRFAYCHPSISYGITVFAPHEPIFFFYRLHHWKVIRRRWRRWLWCRHLAPLLRFCAAAGPPHSMGRFGIGIFRCRT